MDIIRLAVRQPVTVIVGVILVILAGLISLSRLPIGLTPNVDNLVITVSTFWEGASPEDIEQNVIDKQEEKLLSLSGLREITSTSQQDTGTIRLEFQTGTPVEKARQEVGDKLREVPDYPDNVDEPVISDGDRESRDYIAWIMLGSTDPDFDVQQLRDFAVDRIEPALERVPGVSEINVLGGRERELQIRVDAVALAQYGITPTQLARAIQATNQDTSAGLLDDGKLTLRVRTLGQYTDLAEVERTIIAHQGATPIRLGDVAEVVQTFKEQRSFVHSKGEAVIAMNADREVGSNLMAVMDGLKARMAELNAEGGILDAEAQRLGLNGTLYLDQVYDQTIYVEDAIALVRNNIFIGGTLATIVLLLFLRSIRTVGIIAVAIPISVIGAIVAMIMLGRSINVISLAGMAFAVGMVVDNAIVVIENIYRHLEMGKKSMQAAYDGAKEVWGAVLASTLTTIVVFIPILLIQEEAGQLFRDIALAICAAVGLSLVVSITVIPMASGRVLHLSKRQMARLADPAAAAPAESSATGSDGKKGKKKSKPKKRRDPHWVAGAIAGFIHRITGSVAARVAVVLILTIISVVGTVLLLPPADYLPAGNRNLVFGLIIPPPGYSLDQMKDMGDRAEAIMEPFWEAGSLIEEGKDEEAEQAVANLPEVPLVDYATGSVSMITPPPVDNYFFVSFEGGLFHGAVSSVPERVVDLQPLFAYATRGKILPGTFAFAFQRSLFAQGGTTGQAIKLQFTGDDLDELTQFSETIYTTRLGPELGFDKVIPNPNNFMLQTPEIIVDPDYVRLSELGLTVQDVGFAVLANGDGAIIDEYKIGGETIDLKIISQDAVNDQNTTGLIDVPIATPAGAVVPLGSIATIRRDQGPQQIARAGRQRAITFEITPRDDQPLETTIAQVESIVKDARTSGIMPPTIQYQLSGSASKLQAVREALLGDGSIIGLIGSSLFLALLVVYLLMCVLFQSFIRPIVIMFSVPLATLGGFAALYIVFVWSAADRYMPLQKMDVLTMLGFVILIGVVVNNAILLVHQTLNFMEGRADFEGQSGRRLPPRQAITEAVRSRVRPIMMSTCTSVGGMLPLVAMPGSGSELYRGLGSVVVGGLLVSMVFTLLLVPALLSLVLDFQAWLERLREERTAGAAVPSGAYAKSPDA